MRRFGRNDPTLNTSSPRPALSPVLRRPTSTLSTSAPQRGEGPRGRPPDPGRPDACAAPTHRAPSGPPPPGLRREPPIPDKDGDPPTSGLRRWWKFAPLFPPDLRKSGSSAPPHRREGEIFFLIPKEDRA